MNPSSLYRCPHLHYCQWTVIPGTVRSCLTKTLSISPGGTIPQFFSRCWKKSIKPFLKMWSKVVFKWQHLQIVVNDIGSSLYVTLRTAPSESSSFFTWLYIFCSLLSNHTNTYVQIFFLLSQSRFSWTCGPSQIFGGSYVEGMKLFSLDQMSIK